MSLEDQVDELVRERTPDDNLARDAAEKAHVTEQLEFAEKQVTALRQKLKDHKTAVKFMA